MAFLGAHCRALGDLAARPTSGLDAALDSVDGGVRGEAGVALGTVAWRSGQSAHAGVVDALASAAGREVVRVAAVIDGNAQRAGDIVATLTNAGVLVNHRGGGASGLSMLHRIPGVDVILIGDCLADMTFDQLLDNIMYYWITGTANSSGRLYWESTQTKSSALDPWDGHIDIPVGHAVYPCELLQTPRAWAEKRYNIVHWSVQPRGGHFAPFERPEGFAEDLRVFGRLFR